MPRAVILGGTGVLGRATARRLVDAGWRVELTGRHPSHMPADLTAAGVAFRLSDRRDVSALARAIGSGADLLVDALCFTGDDARQLLPLLRDVTSSVMLSSKAVYIDDEGRHSNSDFPPHFDGAIREDHATMSLADTDHNSREGYGANKIAAELLLLDSGFPVTVIRASKVHGPGAARAREWMFVKRILDRRQAVFLAHRGEGRDHTTAAANTAALVERVAAVPGQRILNSADPDSPTALEIVRAIAEHLGYHWDEISLDDDNDPVLGVHPWDARPPIILDTTASLGIGYVPVGTYAETVPAAIDWLVEVAGANRGVALDELFFAPFLDYGAEDRYLSNLTSNTCR